MLYTPPPTSITRTGCNFVISKSTEIKTSNLLEYFVRHGVTFGPIYATAMSTRPISYTSHQKIFYLIVVIISKTIKNTKYLSRTALSRRLWGIPNDVTARCLSNLLIVEPVVLISPLHHKIKMPHSGHFLTRIGIGKSKLGQ